jgi:hypothetical protein
MLCPAKAVALLSLLWCAMAQIPKPTTTVADAVSPPSLGKTLALSWAWPPAVQRHHRHRPHPDHRLQPPTRQSTACCAPASTRTPSSSSDAGSDAIDTYLRTAATIDLRPLRQNAQHGGYRFSQDDAAVHGLPSANLPKEAIEALWKYVQSSPNPGPHHGPALRPRDDAHSETTTQSRQDLFLNFLSTHIPFHPLLFPVACGLALSELGIRTGGA